MWRKISSKSSSKHPPKIQFYLPNITSRAIWEANPRSGNSITKPPKRKKTIKHSSIGRNIDSNINWFCYGSGWRVFCLQFASTSHSICFWFGCVCVQVACPQSVTNFFHISWATPSAGDLPRRSRAICWCQALDNCGSGLLPVLVFFLNECKVTWYGWTNFIPIISILFDGFHYLSLLLNVP